jgi:hypothetical protein
MDRDCPVPRVMKIRQPPSERIVIRGATELLPPSIRRREKLCPRSSEMRISHSPGEAAAAMMIRLERSRAMLRIAGSVPV